MKQARHLVWWVLVGAGVLGGGGEPSLAQISYQRLKSFGFSERLSGVCSEGMLIQGGDGALYGTTYTGGSRGRGTVFRLNTDGTGKTVLREFSGSGGDGANPKAGLVQGDDGALYGTTLSGGTSSYYGTVFKLKSDGSGYAMLKSFAGVNGEGAYPMAGLAQGSNSVFYGTTYYGGESNRGTIFQINADGSGFAYVRGFSGTPGDGAYPDSTLIQGVDGALYGTTFAGGSNQAGTIFKIQLDGTGYTNLHSFAGGTFDGASPLGTLTQGSDGALYGTTFNGGAENKGIVFKQAPDGSSFTLLYSFSGNGQDGAYPAAGVVPGSGGILYGTTMLGGDFANGVIFSMNTDGTGFALLQGFFGGGEGLPQGLLLGNDGALYGTTMLDEQASNGTVFSFSLTNDTFTVLEDFSGIDSDGAAPRAPLVQGSDGALYGTASSGGAYGNGVIFKLDRSGSGYTILRDFLGAVADGANPSAGLLQGLDGAFYGTTLLGGTNNSGTAFKISPDGTGYSSLHFFSGTGGDGANPHAGFAWGADGLLYGTTASGGASSNGTVFAVSLDGSSYQIIKSFSGGANDGAVPEAALIHGSDGAFYGTTVNGGSQNAGTVFQLSTNGNWTVLASLAQIPGGGFNPYGSLVQASDGALYGTTANGGPTAGGGLFTLDLDGSGLTNVYLFQGLPGEGSNPYAGLIEGQDGRLYGTASAGGTNNGGTVFSVNRDGSGYLVLQAFTGTGGDGADPEAALFQTSDGLLFGTTVSGGEANRGTLFVLSATTPTNDSFAQRIGLLNTRATGQGNNFNATVEPGEPLHGDSTAPATNSVWWSWTAAASGPVTILTDGSSFNAIIDVYTGDSVSALTGLASTTGAANSGISNRLNFTATAGTTYQIAISGTNQGFIGLSIQTLTLTLLHVNPTLNADGTTSFSANVQIGNASGVTSGPMRLRLVARAGYSTLQGSPDPGLLPADQLLAIYSLANPTSLVPGTITNIPVSVICPPPIIVDPQKVGFGWGVFALLEEQVGTNWFPKDKDLAGYGLWPTIGKFEGPGGGVIRIDPAVNGSSFNPVSLTNVSLLGPSTVDAGALARFYGTASFDDGSVDFFTNTTWIVSPANAGTIGSNGQFQAGSVPNDTTATITCYYFYEATNTASREILVRAAQLPVISDQPQGGILLAGTNLTLSVAASGTPPLSYQWYLSDAPLAGATNDTLMYTNVQPEQSGTYYVIITNSFGSTTSAVARVAILIPPMITASPSNQTAAVDATVSFQVSASGSPRLSYQWFLGGTILAGATTDTLTLLNVQPDQAGGYSVTITNYVGSVSSQEAQLTVLVPASINLQPAGVAATGVTLSLNSFAGLSYTLEYEDSLSDSGWTPILPAVPGTGQTITLRDTNSPSLSARFYRVLTR